MHLRKSILILITLFSFGFASAQSWVSINGEAQAPATVNLIDDSNTSSTISIGLSGFEMIPVTTPRGEAFVIKVGNSSPLLEKGMPDLPKITTSLIIPNNAEMSISVINSRFKDYEGIEIAPSKGNFKRNIDPSTVPYTYNRIYDIDAFYPTELSSMREPYILRDYRGQTAVITPFAYNPVTKVLRVYYEMTIQVRRTGNSNVNILSSSNTSNSISSDFKQIYDRHFLNKAKTGRYTPLEEVGKMLIISHGAFMAEMQPFIEWKRTIGIPVEIVNVSEIGVNSTAIKNYVANYYATNGLTYLLLVGDHAQVPTVTTGSLGGPSDHAYGYLVGNDHYPDILVGRFSAENAAQVTTQVQRTITYEQNPDISVDWFSSGVGIASQEGPGDDNEYDWQHMRNIRTDLLGYTYTSISELYEGSQGGVDLPGHPNTSMVTTEVNAGRTIINYVGHGSQTSWGTTGFSNSQVNALNNNGKWPFIFSVACVNGDFLTGTCFAEAWLRATNANGPTGAVAALMSTINQSWNPPMDGQDEINDIIIESYSNNIKRTFGGVSMNGCLKMNDTYGAGGYEITDTWLIFGDPSVMLRTAMPTQLAVTHNNVAFIGSNEYTIACSVNGAKACITMNGNILGTATIENGTATINFPPLTTPGLIKLAVTAFNHIPYIAEIEVIPVDGAYIVFDNAVVHDSQGNNNMQLDYNEYAYLNLGFRNAGNDIAENTAITIRSNNQYVTIADSTEVYGTIASGETVSITDGFNIYVAANVPEGYDIPFTYTATSGSESWTGNFVIKAHSVILNYAGMTINDETGNNNGKVDAGETVILNISMFNSGNAAATNAYGLISTASPYLYINIDSVYYGSMNGQQTIEAQFMVTALPTTPTGSQIQLTFTGMADGDFLCTSTPSFVVGQKPALIIDLDGNHNSGTRIRTCLTNLNIPTDYITTWPSTIGPYQSVFVCLGTYDRNVVLSDAQGQALANYMSTLNGCVYMEGADTWAYDNQTAAHEMFKIGGLSDGSSDLSTVNGLPGTFTEGMSFTFNGDNSYIDRISLKETAFDIFQNANPNYVTAVAYNGGNYKTIGASFEFGGLVDGQGKSVKDSLMLQYVNFFGITNASPVLVNFVADKQLVCIHDVVTFTDFSAGNIVSWNWEFPGGNPSTSTEQNPQVRYDVTGSYDVTLTVNDGTDNYSTTKSKYITVDVCESVINLLTSDLKLFPNPADNSFTLVIPGNGIKSDIRLFTVSGNQLMHTTSAERETVIDIKNIPTGIYFVNVRNTSINKTIKLVVTK